MRPDYILYRSFSPIDQLIYRVTVEGTMARLWSTTGGVWKVLCDMPFNDFDTWAHTNDFYVEQQRTASKIRDLAAIVIDELNNS